MLIPRVAPHRRPTAILALAAALAVTLALGGAGCSKSGEGNPNSGVPIIDTWARVDSFTASATGPRTITYRLHGSVPDRCTDLVTAAVVDTTTMTVAVTAWGEKYENASCPAITDYFAESFAVDVPKAGTWTVRVEESRDGRPEVEVDVVETVP
ncbi:hypothetical protein KDM41_06770 [bacterium]|nr:hypothetical protein [bacterium]